MDSTNGREKHEVLTAAASAGGLRCPAATSVRLAARFRRESYAVRTRLRSVRGPSPLLPSLRVCGARSESLWSLYALSRMEIGREVEKEEPRGEREERPGGEARTPKPARRSGSERRAVGGRSCGAKDSPKTGQDRGVGLKSAFSDSLEVELALIGDYALPLGDRAARDPKGASHLRVVAVVLSCLV